MRAGLNLETLNTILNIHIQWTNYIWGASQIKAEAQFFFELYGSCCYIWVWNQAVPGYLKYLICKQTNKQTNDWKQVQGNLENEKNEEMWRKKFF